MKVEELTEEASVPEEEQPYQVPENWVWTNISQFIELERGITFPASAKRYRYEEGLIGCARTANVQEQFDWDDMIYVSEDYTKGNDKKIVKKDDILMSTANSSHLVGKVSYIDELKENITFGGFLMCIRTSTLQPRFLYYYLRKLFLSGKIQKLASQTTNIANINGKKIQSLTIPLPPINEQKRIVDKVEHLLNKIDQAKQLIEEAKETFELRRAAILDKAFRGRLTTGWRKSNKDTAAILIKQLHSELRIAKSNERSTLNAIEEPYVLPDGWEWSRIGDIFKVQIGSTPSRKEDSYWAGGNYPWISSGEVQFREINDSREKVTEKGVKEKRLKLAPRGSILFAMIGEGKTRGQVAKLNINAYHNQNIASIHVSNTPIPSSYVYYWLQSQYLRNRQNSSGNNQPAYNKSRVEALLIPIPPLEEQKVIIKILDTIMRQHESSEELLNFEGEISLLEQSLLNKAFRGELETNNFKEYAIGDLENDLQYNNN